MLILLLAAALWFAERQGWLAQKGDAGDRTETAERGGSGGSAKQPNGAGSSGGAIEQAFREKRSKVWVEGEGEIVHLLPDDRVAPRHQLFLVELASGHTIKISHNVDLAPKVPVRKRDRIRFRGRFEWNDKGGVVHWTHHDPRGRRAGGWLRHEGKTYK